MGKARGGPEAVGGASRARLLSWLTWSAWMGALSGMAGCPTASPPPPPTLDSSTIQDGPSGSASEDPDGDGLCTATERNLGTDPMAADTDGDGWPDGAEWQASSDPTDATEPDPAFVDALTEGAGAPLYISVLVETRARGHDLTGGIEDTALFEDGRRASQWLAALRAAAAYPSYRVAWIDEENATYRGVEGRVLVAFELSFQVPAEAARGCARAYPYWFVLKRNDGVRWIVQRRWLRVAAPQGTGATEAWCLSRPPRCL